MAPSSPAPRCRQASLFRLKLPYQRLPGAPHIGPSPPPLSPAQHQQQPWICCRRRRRRRPMVARWQGGDACSPLPRLQEKVKDMHLMEKVAGLLAESNGRKKNMA
ncbi:uncharacterized protein LOC124657897 isoform X2 [Lolium rigidum]|uniref:uncharacterized protein LOC124657897 isoform X2 n=1 Tax=Lolium rigidum TaxID=89674 RepID=UPI001F5D25A4|nr:uncharacterized protein LOC124657897 isoform X2 [Lolium rigidum]